jgi:RNA polymerase-binding transcription factor
VGIDLEAIRHALERERDALAAELGILTAVERDPGTIGFGKRVGEGTAQAVERIERVGQAGALAAKYGDVERALTKFEEGTYGICDRCGATISDERLEARPASVLCMRCSISR